MQTIGIIPVRYQSTRFPGKPLIDIAGKTMIRRVYEQASKATMLSDIIVATDDKRIAREVSSFGGKVQMTSTDHQSGTDRCAEVAIQYQDIAAIINIQGDEPFIDPSQIDLLVSSLQTEQVQIATLVKPIQIAADLWNSNMVKAVFQKNGKALYFSRSPIPYVRGSSNEEWIKKHKFYQHIGVYGYKRATLLELAKLAKSPLEKSESLEQLRWLENGFPIQVTITDKATFGIDTPEDWEKAKLIAKQLKL